MFVWGKARVSLCHQLYVRCYAGVSSGFSGVSSGFVGVSSGFIFSQCGKKRVRLASQFLLGQQWRSAVCV